MIFTEKKKKIRVMFTPFRDGLQSSFGGKTRLADILPAMEWADLGVIMGGGTLWECMAAGLPVASFSLDEIQSTILDRLAEADYISSLGSINDILSGTCDSVLEDLVLERERRTTMSRAGRELVDGKGAQRVVSVMKTIEDE